jgi:hypothetical protein
MTHRERLQATLNHRQPDALCADMGATAVTGIAVSTVHRLRQAVLSQKDYRAKVIEPYQMLGEVDEELRSALELDVRGIGGPRTRYGFANADWRPMELFDGTPVLVPGGFRPTIDSNGDWLLHPQGDPSLPASVRMPKDGYYFDAIIRQEPIDEDKLDPRDNLEEFAPYSQEVIDHFAAQTKLAAASGYGVIISPPGLAFGDISHVPGVGLARPKGIRDITEWYISLLTRQDYIYKVFEGQCRISLGNLQRLVQAVGDNADAIFITGADFGTQRGLFISPEVYRKLFKPFHRQLNDFVHKHTKWKTFIHSCGAIVELIPDLIEAGFDAFNPVQTSAEGMDPVKLKKEFGKQITFWGGGVDTQKTLPFGTADEVYRQVRERIDILGEGGGFVFASIHNVQANTPTENLLAMFRAVADARKVGS